MLVSYLIQTLSTDWMLNSVVEKSEILPRFHLGDCKNGGFFTKIEKGSESKWQGTSTHMQRVCTNLSPSPTIKR